MSTCKIKSHATVFLCLATCQFLGAFTTKSHKNHGCKQPLMPICSLYRMHHFKSHEFIQNMTHKHTIKNVKLWHTLEDKTEKIYTLNFLHNVTLANVQKWISILEWCLKCIIFYYLVYATLFGISLMFLKLSRSGAIVNSTKPCKRNTADKYVSHISKLSILCNFNINKLSVLICHVVMKHFIHKNYTYYYTLPLNINSCQTVNLLGCKQSWQLS